MTTPQEAARAEPLSADEVEIIRTQAAKGDGVYYLFGARHDILALLATLDAAVSARQEAERVLGELREAAAEVLAATGERPPEGPEPTTGEVEKWYITNDGRIIRALAALRATLARTREPAGEGTR